MQPATRAPVGHSIHPPYDRRKRPTTPRLADVFNIQGSELIFLLLIALIVLGPEKLPDAIRKFGRAYAEFKKMANGFQGELREALDEPMRELRETSDMMRAAVNFNEEDGAAPTAAPETPATPPPITREQGLNFGSANPRRSTPAVDPSSAAPQQADTTDENATDTPATAPVQREPGLNFGSANPTRPKPARDPLAPVEMPPIAEDATE